MTGRGASDVASMTPRVSFVPRHNTHLKAADEVPETAALGIPLGITPPCRAGQPPTHRRVSASYTYVALPLKACSHLDADRSPDLSRMAPAGVGDLFPFRGGCAHHPAKALPLTHITLWAPCVHDPHWGPRPPLWLHAGIKNVNGNIFAFTVSAPKSTYSITVLSVAGGDADFGNN